VPCLSLYCMEVPRLTVVDLFQSLTNKFLLLQFFTLNNNGGLEMESLLFLLHAVEKFDTCKFHINSYNIIKVIVILQCSVQL